MSVMASASANAGAVVAFERMFGMVFCKVLKMFWVFLCVLIVIVLLFVFYDMKKYDY